MNSTVEQFIAFLRLYDGINDKAKLATLGADGYGPWKLRHVGGKQSGGFCSI